MMLKKELQQQLAAANSLIQNFRESSRKDHAEIKRLLEDSEKLAHYEETGKSVIRLIGSLKSILCPDSVKFQRQSYDLHRMAENGEQIPERPKDQLFDILSEIETRMMNGGLTNINLL